MRGFLLKFPIAITAITGIRLLWGRALPGLPPCSIKDNPSQQRRKTMKQGDHLVIIGSGGVGGPAAMLSRKLMPEVKITLIRAEDRFIVR